MVNRRYSLVKAHIKWGSVLPLGRIHRTNGVVVALQNSGVDCYLQSKEEKSLLLRLYFHRFPFLKRAPFQSN